MAFWRRPTIWDKIAEDPKASLSLTREDVDAEAEKMNSLLEKNLRTRLGFRRNRIAEQISEADKRMLAARAYLEIFRDALQHKGEMTRKKIAS